MSICLRTGMPGDPCGRCARVDRLLLATREDPRVRAQFAVVEAAWRAKQAGRDLPLAKWLVLDAAHWRAVSELGVIFSQVWAEKAEEIDHEDAS